MVSYTYLHIFLLYVLDYGSFLEIFQNKVFKEVVGCCSSLYTGLCLQPVSMVVWSQHSFVLNFINHVMKHTGVEIIAT